MMMWQIFYSDAIIKCKKAQYEWKWQLTPLMGTSWGPKVPKTNKSSVVTILLQTRGQGHLNPHWHPNPHPTHLNNKHTQLVIQGSHMVSGTQCPAWSGVLQEWSESRAAALKSGFPVGHRGEFPDVLRGQICGYFLAWSWGFWAWEVWFFAWEGWFLAWEGWFWFWKRHILGLRANLRSKRVDFRLGKASIWSKRDVWVW